MKQNNPPYLYEVIDSSGFLRKVDGNGMPYFIPQHDDPPKPAENQQLSEDSLGESIKNDPLKPRSDLYYALITLYVVPWLIIYSLYSVFYHSIYHMLIWIPSFIGKLYKLPEYRAEVKSLFDRSDGMCFISVVLLIGLVEFGVAAACGAPLSLLWVFIGIVVVLAAVWTIVCRHEIEETMRSKQ